MKTKIIPALTFLAFGFLWFIVLSGTASASTIFTDDFESYELGQLNGQGGWVVPSYYTYAPQVQNTYVKEGEKGIKVYGEYLFAYGAEKTGTSTNDGMITIYMQKFLGGTPQPESIIELKQENTIIASFKNREFIARSGLAIFV